MKPPAILGLHDDEYERYVWDHVRTVLGLRVETGLVVCWGTQAHSQAKAVVVVPRDGAFLDGGRELTRWASPENAADGLAVESGTPPVVRLEADVLSWIGWFVSRAEEYEPFHADIHGRFPRSAALAEKLGVMEQPVADCLVLRLRRAIELAAQAARLSTRPCLPWPDGKRFAVCMTHDVDHAIGRSPWLIVRKFGAALLSLAKGDGANFRRRVSDGIGFIRGGRHSPYWLFQPMAELEASLGIRSAFYLMPHLGETVREGDRRDNHYDLRRKDILELFRGLAAQGWELGLHTTYPAHDSATGHHQDWQRLRDILGENVTPVGGRSHYLRFRVPETWRRSADAGMQYDATLGWASGWGFRSGTCWPHRPFDRLAGQPISIWDLGMHIMDVAIADSDALVASVEQLLDRARAVGGCACLLFHPCPTSTTTVGKYLRIYETVLRRIAGMADAWIATPREVIVRLEQSSFGEGSRSAAESEGVCRE